MCPQDPYFASVKDHLLRVARHASLQRKLYENRAGWFNEVTRVVQQRMYLPSPPVVVRPKPAAALVSPDPPAAAAPVSPDTPVLPPAPFATVVPTPPPVLPAAPDFTRCWEIPAVAPPPPTPEWNVNVLKYLLVMETARRIRVPFVFWCEMEYLAQRAECGLESLLLPAPGCSDALPALQSAPWPIE